ncbi:LOW QUALITY PROTEIN: matrin-3-like [Scomber scombrus]|uniref:LOW QUALITY PROTEIN: matrin-3-like n=1 Tax=Scomber scombrus TaxID=13677 RepID=A0AAV1Q0V0_SCOSC
MPRRGGNHLGSTMKLFASLGLSPSDLDALAQIPEEDISVETLPHILMQLKSRKGDAGERRAASSMSDRHRGGRDTWDDAHMGRMGAASLAQSSDFGFGSLQDAPPGRGYGLNYGGRERPFSELSHDPYGGLGMGTQDPVFMQRRIGSPSHGKVQDFLGVLPPLFPHVCSLCDFDVHSSMEWNQHVNGLRHAENRRMLLDMYPDWDPGMSSGRSRGLDTPNLSAGLLGPAPMTSGQAGGGTSSSWGGDGPGKSQQGPNKLRSRVVVVKYDRKPLSNKTLFAFTEPFGCLSEHLVLKNKAFLEMESHEEAQDVVNYYQQHPASLYGKPVTFYLSKRLLVIEKDERSSDRLMDRPDREVKGHGSHVVFFSNLPREEEKKKELLTIAGRFGTVDKHLFLTDQAFVQLGTPEDAEMLVKYYSVNPLTIKGRPIRLNLCTKYKTLNVNRRQGRPAGEGNAEEEVPDVKKECEDSEEEKVAVAVGDDVTVEAPGGGGGAEGEGADSEPTEPELKEEPSGEPGESSETLEGDLPEDTDDQDFLENMEDFVTLDEVAEDEDEAHEESDTIDNTRKGGMRVVNIVGFRRGFNFTNELLGLAKPFGKLVKHLVLDLRPEAYLQFETEEEARAMAKFYNGNVTATVCGRPVRVSHSMSYPTIQCGSSKVVYIGQIPNSKYTDEAILKLAQRFGKVKKYFLNRIKRECFIEMDKAEEAEKMAEDYRANPPKFNGKRLTIYVSRKYRQLKYGHRCPSAVKREKSCTPPKSSKHPEEPPAKKSKEDKKPADEKEGEEEEEEEEEEKLTEKVEEEKNVEEQQEDEKKEEETQSCEEKREENSAEQIPVEKSCCEVKQEEQSEEMEISANQNGQTEAAPPAENKPSAASLPLPPYEPNNPIGVEHVKMGYYCRVCFLFYSNEDTAKKTHCSSQAHYDKLQKHLEKEQTKAEKKKGKKTTVN